MSGLKQGDITIKEGLERYDEPARHAAKVFLPEVLDGVRYLVDHEDQYDVDLIAIGPADNQVAYVELECSKSWGRSEEFPKNWEGLSFLEERKGKYLYEERYLDMPFYFVMFNENCTAFALVDRKILLESPIVKRYRTWRGSGVPEMFRMVPKGKFKFYKTKDFV